VVAGVAAAALAAPFALGASHQRAKYQPHGENRAEDISNAIEKEQDALDWLDRTPPHFGDSYRRMKEALQSLGYATQYLGYDDPVSAPLEKAKAADEDAQAVDTNIWPKSKAEKKIEAALALKKQALKLERAKDAGPAEGCTLSYPPAVAPAETTIGISGCVEPVGSVKLTFPFGVAKVTSYGLASPGSFVSGPCTKADKTISCGLGDPWNPEALFFVAISPQVKPGEHIGVDLVPFTSGGQPWHFDAVVSAGPKLSVSATAKDNGAAGTARRTSFTFIVKVRGPFQNIVINYPRGERFGIASQKPPTGGLSCGVQSLAGGGQRTICAPLLGQQEPPGTYTFGASFATPLKPGAKLEGSVTGIGASAPKTFVVGTGR
jgi:hypothetical protein